MRIKISPDVFDSLKKIKQKDKELARKIEHQLQLFKNNPKHPSLRAYKLSGKLKSRWSISMTRGIRMVYILQDSDVAFFVDLGTHDQVYRK